MGLTAAHIAHIQILPDLISTGAKLHSDPVMALVHIFVDVLDGLDRGNRLYLDVALILPDEILGVTDHPSAVHHLAIVQSHCPACVPSPDAGIGVLSDRGPLHEGLWKTLETFVIHHARGVGVLCPTRPMNHDFLDKYHQVRVALWELRGHQTINVLWRAQLGLRLQENNDVGMRKAPLPKLYGIEVGIDSTKYTHSDILHQALNLGFEDPNHQVRAIGSLLAMKEFRLNLRLLSIGSHGDE
jgi:hypothetical protein